jgi:hypothetical protein
MKERSTLTILAVVVVILAAVLFAYAASYWMLIDDAAWDIDIVRIGQSGMVVQKVVKYRYGGEAARTLFWPAHRVDRWLRSDYWELGPAGIDIEIEQAR